MPQITFNQAKEFLNNITSKDVIAIIHHDDGDGFCAGILYYDWCKSKNAQAQQFTYEIGRTKLKNIDLEKFNKFIVTDIASNLIAEDLELIKQKQVLYADHHPRDTPIPEEILELVTTDQGYLPSSRTAGELTNLKPWLSLIGTITDAGELYPENQNFIDKNLKKINTTLDKFKQNISSVVTNFLTYFDKDFPKAFEILQQINSIEEVSKLKQYSEPVENEVQKFVEEYEAKKEKLGDINYYYFEPHYSIKVEVAGIISRKNPNNIYIFASPKNDGKDISFSARGQSKKLDMAELLKAGTNGLKDTNAGGHKAAAGALIQSKDLEQFKQNIKNFQNSTP